jgi:hypothetical protein
MKIITIISAILSIVGALITIFITIRKKSLSKPKLKLIIGFPLEKSELKNLRKRKTLIYCVDNELIKNPVILLHYKVANKGNFPINDIKIRIDYPSNHSIKDTYFFEIDGMTATAVKLDFDHTEQGYGEFTIGDRKQSEYSLDKLRIGETMNMIHPLRVIPYPNNIRGGENSRHFDLSTKYEEIENYINGMEIGITIHSIEAEPISEQFQVLLINGKTIASAQDTLESIIQKSWDGEKPEGGFYYVPSHLRWFKPKQYSLKYIFAREYGLITISNINYNELINNSSNAISKTLLPKFQELELALPPWGFFGASYKLLPGCGPVNGRNKFEKKALLVFKAIARVRNILKNSDDKI